MRVTHANKLHVSKPLLESEIGLRRMIYTVPRTSKGIKYYHYDKGHSVYTLTEGVKRTLYVVFVKSSSDKAEIPCEAKWVVDK